MSTPVVAPSKLKTYVALAGSVLAFIVPLLVSVENYLPSPWPVIIGGIIALLTGLGVYKAPYAPAGTSVVHDTQVVNPAPPAGGYKNPWQ